MPSVWTAVGTLAALLTSTSFIPQIVKAHKTRSMEDLSWGLLLTFGAGVFLWLLYGFHLNDPIIIGANLFTFSNITILCVQKIVFRRTPPGGS